MRLFRRRRSDDEAPPPAPLDVPEYRSFGYKGTWLAVRSSDPADVADALGLAELAPSGWAAGVSAVYQASGRPSPVFVGTPVDGWVLAPFPFELEGEFDLGALSARFGEVQRFATHRVVEAHEWERWMDGEPVRRYGYLGESGEVTFAEGEPSEHEEDLLPAGTDDSGDWEYADEERVMEIAGVWSVDPTTLDERADTPDSGLLGYR